MRELADRTIARRYMDLAPQERRPNAFWRIVTDVLPHLRSDTPPPMQSWATVESILLAPDVFGIDPLGEGSDPDTLTIHDAAAVARIAMAMVRVQSGRLTSDRVDLEPRLCAFCWRVGTAPRRKTGFQAAEYVEGDVASSVRCTVHRPLQAQADVERQLAFFSDVPAESPKAGQQSSRDDRGYTPTSVRRGRARENVLLEMERERRRVDREQHAGNLWNGFEMRLKSIVAAENQSEWAGFMQRIFPFAAYDEQFDGLCESPERALTVLDDEGNTYPERERIHAALLSDRSKLGFYLLLMVLRADTWVELEERARLEKAYRARIKRLAQRGCSDPKIRFKMPSREEYFISKQGACRS